MDCAAKKLFAQVNVTLRAGYLSLAETNALGVTTGLILQEPKGFISRHFLAQAVGFAVIDDDPLRAARFADALVRACLPERDVQVSPPTISETVPRGRATGLLLGR